MIICSSGLHWYVITGYRLHRKGAVDDFTIAAAEAYPASSRLWIRRGRRQDEAEGITSLALLRRGLRSHQLVFPPSNGAVEWPEIHLVKKAA